MTIFTIMVIVIFHTTCFIYIYMSKHITVHFKYAQFIVGQFYLYKVFFKFHEKSGLCSLSPLNLGALCDTSGQQNLTEMTAGQFQTKGLRNRQLLLPASWNTCSGRIWPTCVQSDYPQIVSVRKSQLAYGEQDVQPACMFLLSQPGHHTCE